jgi:DNA-binding transcriptional LysR family regulator
MEAFVRVIETGSFSAAAQQMRLGQPAVSKAVGQLEQRLGVRLVLRSTRGLTPTEAGRAFTRKQGPLSKGLNRPSWPLPAQEKACRGGSGFRRR